MSEAGRVHEQMSMLSLHGRALARAFCCIAARGLAGNSPARAHCLRAQSCCRRRLPASLWPFQPSPSPRPRQLRRCDCGARRLHPRAYHRQRHCHRHCHLPLNGREAAWRSSTLPRLPASLSSQPSAGASSPRARLCLASRCDRREAWRERQEARRAAARSAFDLARPSRAHRQGLSSRIRSNSASPPPMGPSSQGSTRVQPFSAGTRTWYSYCRLRCMHACMGADCAFGSR